MTEQEIRERYVKWHNRISKRYYVNKTLTKEKFDISHNKCWKEMEAELIDTGYKQPQPKHYLLYIKKITTPKRTIYKNKMELKDLTPEEIIQFELEGYTVEEF